MEITGRVVADATVKEVKGDKKVTNFRIAINDRYRANGENVEVTTYVDCAYWRNPGIAEYLKKGGLVQLYGRIGANAWVNKDGEPQATLTLHVNEIKLLGGARNNGMERQDNKTQVKETVYTDGKKGDDDDLPF